jgi:hypothetical protein
MARPPASLRPARSAISLSVPVHDRQPGRDAVDSDHAPDLARIDLYQQ